MSYNTPELIRTKREGGELNDAQLRHIVQGYLDGNVEKYQLSAFLMAVFFKGMTPDEAATLTRVMIESGAQYDLSKVSNCPTDKHSTGGVGDKVSLILAPLVASVGVVNPMVSGRGLGHTGGTLDKLDAIPGYRWDLSFDEFCAQLDKVGCSIIGQTASFVPADKEIYALRDVTGTVESVPLISASILSKKCAAGSKALVMDVKCGSGAFMDSEERALELSKSLVRIGTALDMNVTAIITQMNQPLGTMIGNSLEVLESLDLLEGKGPKDSRDITLELAAEMIVLAGVEKDQSTALKLVTDALDSGKAMEKFKEWISGQHGNPKIVDDRSLLDQVNTTKPIKAKQKGVIQSINTRRIGIAANTLGAGRMKTTDEVDPAVGLEFFVKVGDEVSEGQDLALAYHRDNRGLDECERIIHEAVVIGDEKKEPLPLIINRVE